MRNENVSELLYLNEMLNMDCSSEGSTDIDCDCDGVDGSTA